jgi:hypothetical protein
MKRFTIVDFSDGGDECEALYIDGNLFRFKDYNKSISITSFIDGFKFADGKCVEERITCKNSELIEGIKEYGNEPPQNLNNI